MVRLRDLPPPPPLTDEEREQRDVATLIAAWRTVGSMYATARVHPSYAEHVAWVRWGRLWTDGPGRGDAAAVAAAVLEAAREPDDPAVIDRLAHAVSEHAARFRDSVTWPRVKLDADRAATLRDHLDRPDPFEPGARALWAVGDDDTLTAWQAAALAPLDAHRAARWWADARDRGDELTDDELAEVIALVKVPDELDAATLGRAVGGVPWLSEELGRYLDKLDAEIGKGWREKERGREEARLQQLALDGGPGIYLSGWLEAADVTTPLPAAALTLALAVWRGEVWPDLREERIQRERTRAPALPLQLHRSTGGTLFARPSLDGGRVLVGDVDTGLALLPGAPVTDGAALAAALPHLHTLAGHRAVRWLASTAYEATVAGASGHDYEAGPVRASMNRVGGAVSIEVTGGKAELAAVVGGTSKQDANRVFGALDALRLSHPVEWAGAVDAGGVSGLVASLRAVRGGPGKPGRVLIELPSLWTPGAVNLLPKGDAGRVLVPVLPVPPMPAGQERHAPALAALDAAALAYVAAHSDHLVTFGGVLVPWGELAAERNVSPEALAAALKRWAHDGDDGPARWTETGRGRWALAERDELEAARAVLAEGGARKVGGRRAGRRAVNARITKATGKGRK